MHQEIHLAHSDKELLIREGEAPKLYPPRKVVLEGNIYAPGEFLSKRKEEINAFKKFTHVVVDYENLNIKLTVNEEDEFAKFITGKLEFFNEFLQFGINRPVKFSVNSLYKMLRLKRAYFKNREEHAQILDQLKKFEAKTEIEFSSTNDFKGHTAIQKIEKCKTNLTYQFTLNIPIYKGMDASTFPVEIEFEPTDGSIVCWLMSEDLAELEIKLRDDTMKAEVEKFNEFAIIIK